MNRPKLQLKAPKIVATSVAAFSLLLGANSYATVYSGTGQVNSVNASDLTYYGANTDSLMLTGVTSLGGCGKSAFTGLVFMRFKDDLHGQQMYAAALSAALTGTAVGISVDDTYKDSSGYCYVINLSIG